MGILKSFHVGYVGVIFFVALIIYFPTTDRPLRDAEAKYAEMPRQMLILGDWLTPYLNNARCFGKPPLTYWATALLYRTFGVSERVARLANIFLAFLTAFLTGVLCEKLFGNGAGYLSSALFLLTSGVYAYCLDAGIEFGLISFIVLAFIFFWDFYQKASLLSLCLFYLSLGLVFMAKGLVGVAIVGGTIFLFLLFNKDMKKLIKLLQPQGVAVFLILSVPWTMVMLKKHPDFFHVSFVNEYLNRFTGTMDSNDAIFSTPLFLALVAGQFFPWIIYLPQLGIALSKMVSRKIVPREKILFLLLWALIPLIIFSLSQSKVDFYGLHSYPPLIILLSLPLRDLLGSKNLASPKSWAYPWMIVSALGLLSTLFLLLAKDQKLVHDLEIPSLGVALVFLIAAFALGLLIALGFLKGKVKLALLCIFLLMLIFFHSVRAMFVASFPNESMKFAADTFNEAAEREAILVSDERPEFEHVATLNFYTGRPVFLLRDNNGSILHFIQKDRQAMCFDETDLVRLCQEGHVVYLVGQTEKTQKRLSQLKLRSKILSSGGNRSLFRLEF